MKDDGTRTLPGMRRTFIHNESITAPLKQKSGSAGRRPPLYGELGAVHYIADNDA
jgi:hypothetical protein